MKRKKSEVDAKFKENKIKVSNETIFSLRSPLELCSSEKKKQETVTG